jgi:hypothetical protein
MGLWQVPAAVLLFLTWYNAPPTSLGDASRRETLRRQILPQATHTLSNENLPAPRPVFSEPEPPASTTPDKPETAAGSDADKAKPETHDEKWWNTRITAARQAVDHDQSTIDALQSQINGLTTDWINRDDPAQKSQLEQRRNKAIDDLNRMKTQIDVDKKSVDDIMDEARRAGVPPGWLRGGGL